MPWLRRIICSFVALAGCVACAPLPEAGSAEVRAVPLVDPRGSKLPDRIGALDVVGAYDLRSRQPDFGGISGIRLLDGRLYLLSDRSVLFELAWPAHTPGASFTMPLVAKRSLVDSRSHPLDAEALEIGADGTMLVGDEEYGRVLTYAPRANAPAATRELPGLFAAHRRTNEGLETLARLPDGSLLAISEGAWAGQDLHAVEWVGRGEALPLRYRSAAGFRPTDAAVAGDRLFVLERRLSLFGGWQNRIVTLPVTELPDRADDVIEPAELATISGPVLGENYEGLDVRRVDDGSYALSVVADDNFNGIQHTQLLELRWRP